MHLSLLLAFFGHIMLSQRYWGVMQEEGERHSKSVLPILGINCDWEDQSSLPHQQCEVSASVAGIFWSQMIKAAKVGNAVFVSQSHREFPRVVVAGGGGCCLWAPHLIRKIGGKKKGNCDYFNRGEKDPHLCCGLNREGADQSTASSCTTQSPVA